MFYSAVKSHMSEWLDLDEEFIDVVEVITILFINKWFNYLNFIVRFVYYAPVPFSKNIQELLPRVPTKFAEILIWLKSSGMVLQ